MTDKTKIEELSLDERIKELRDRKVDSRDGRRIRDLVMDAGEVIAELQAQLEAERERATELTEDLAFLIPDVELILEEAPREVYEDKVHGRCENIPEGVYQKFLRFKAKWTSN